MAIYGFDVKTISRLREESVSKTASYILRTNIFDEYNHETHYYSHVKDLLYSEIFIPKNAPPEFTDIDTLLAEIDRTEKRYDARTGRVVRLSLPNDKEFSDGERIELARHFVKNAFISQGMCAIMAIHAGQNKDPTKNNPHAHIMLTDRPVDADGFCSRKNRDWNRTEQLYRWRKLWADIQNKAFKAKGLELNVCHESLEVQGIDREPTIPLGRAATALERKGIPTEQGNKNREIELRYKQHDEKQQYCLKKYRKHRHKCSR